jgi:uncharacterized protein
MTSTLTPQRPHGRSLVESYGEGGFKVGGQWHAGSLLVLAERTVPWSVAAAGEVGVEALGDIFATTERVEILILGCGARFVPMPDDLRAELRRRGVGLEWMDTGAACRTYNVLAAEGRPVAAALIAVP